VRRYTICTTKITPAIFIDSFQEEHMRIKGTVVVAVATLFMLCIGTPAQAQFGWIRDQSKKLVDEVKKTRIVNDDDKDATKNDVGKVAEAIENQDQKADDDKDDDANDGPEFKVYNHDRYHHKTAKGRQMRAVEESARPTSFAGTPSESLAVNSDLALASAQRYLEQKGLSLTKRNEEGRVYSALMERRVNNQQEGKRIVVAVEPQGTSTVIKVAVLRMERDKGRIAIGKPYKPEGIRVDETESREILNGIKSQILRTATVATR
jgi:hypothetical protein